MPISSKVSNPLAADVICFIIPFASFDPYSVSKCMRNAFSFLSAICEYSSFFNNHTPNSFSSSSAEIVPSSRMDFSAIFSLVISS